MTTHHQAEALAELHALVVEDTEGTATLDGAYTRRTIINDYNVDELDVRGCWHGTIIDGNTGLPI